MTMLPIDDSGARIQALRPDVAHSVPIGAAPHVSAPFGDGTTVIRLVATVPCLIALGPAPSAAAAAGHYLAAGAPEYFRVSPREAVAAVRISGDGTLHLSEMR